jgi:hypothetical protein
MAIKVLDEPDVTVTATELARYRADYQQDFMFYSGTPPTLNEYIYRRQQRDRKIDERRNRMAN